MIESKDYIAEIEILDTYGTEQAVFKPRSVTAITGSNGTGKSSIIRALLYVFAGGSDPGVIRQGADRSVVRLRLASGVVITKTTAFKKKGEGVRTQVEILDPEGQVVSAPMAYISQLSEAIAVDPGAVLRIDASTVGGKKALADLLMKIVPIEFRREEVTEAATYEVAVAKPGTVSQLTGTKWIGEQKKDVVPLALPAGEHLSLDALKAAIAQVRDLRRRAGVVYDEADATVNQLQRSLPEESEEISYEALLDQAETARREIDKRLVAARFEVEQAKHEAIQAATAAWSAGVKEVNDDIDAKIRALESERSARNLGCRDTFESAKSKIADLVKAELERVAAEARGPLDEVTTRIATLKEKAANQQRAVIVREQVESYTRKSLEAGWKQSQLTGVIERLEGMKQAKLDALPVAGLEVSEGGVLVDGVEWQNVNTARRVEIAMQVCSQCAGRLGVLMIDNCEALDSETWRLLKEAIAESGFQLIAAMVEDGPLKIEVAA